MLTQAVRPVLAEQYADMLAQDHRLRNVLLSSYHHIFSDLHRFDRRMLACLEGMVLLKEEVADYLRGQLDDILSPGDLFSTALFAASTDDEFLLSGCLGVVQAMPRLRPALLAATDWMPDTSSLWSLLTSYPACRAYIAVTRNSPSPAVAFSQQEIVALVEQNQGVEYLLYALHSSGSSWFVPALDMVLSSERDDVRICGYRMVHYLHPLPEEYIRVAREGLLQLAANGKGSGICAQAVKSLMIYFSPESHEVIRSLDPQKDTRLLIQAMGWSGLSEFIPALAAYFNEPEYARLSALSVIAITGSLPERDNWQRSSEEPVPAKGDPGSAEIPGTDPEQGVCWPDIAAFQRWWKAHHSRFSSRIPWLGGQPATPEGISAVIAEGYLNLRPFAAIRQGIFPVFTSLLAERQSDIFPCFSGNNPRS